MKNVLLCLVASAFLISCGGFKSYKMAEVPGRFVIEVPEWLKTTTELNNEASLQYENAFKELYVIVIEEGQEEFIKAITENNLNEVYSPNLKGYTTLVSEGFKESIEGSSVTPARDTIIGNKKALVFEVDGTVKQVNIHYKMACIEGKTHFYQLMTWTLTSKRKENEDKMNHMIYSFREKA